jgi:hypothetical protein
MWRRRSAGVRTCWDRAIPPVRGVGLPAGHVGFREGVSNSELGITDRKLAPNGMGTGPGGPVTYWEVDDVAPAFRSTALRGARQLQPPTELTRGFMIASMLDPFGNVLRLRLDPDYLFEGQGRRGWIAGASKFPSTVV